MKHTNCKHKLAPNMRITSYTGVGPPALPPMRGGLGSRRRGNRAQGGGQGGAQSARGRPLHLQVAKTTTCFEVVFLAIAPFTNLNLRATMDGARLIGKINPKHHVCYLPHDGKEVIQ